MTSENTLLSIFAKVIIATMRIFFITTILLSVASMTLAQNVETPTVNESEVVYNDANSTSSPTADNTPVSSVHHYDTSGFAPSLLQTPEKDSLHLPSLNMKGQMQSIGMYPLTWSGWYNWELHKGLNVNLGASVFAQFGKHARHGAGFSQNIAMMYAMPLTDKLSFAVGGYFNNTYWSHDSFRDAGLSAVLGYKFDEHWEVYLYGQKSLTDNARLPFYIYDISNAGDRIGAAVKYNFNNNASIQLSVEGASYPTPKRYSIEQPIRPNF